MHIIGGLLIALGIADFVLSLSGVELYSAIGIQLPGIIYENSPYIAGGLGGLFIFLNNSKGEFE
jgi:hypothetical protein